MDQSELNYLFDEVQNLLNEYEDDIKKTGEGFNVFKILGLSYNEVRTHTAFIADLLNPAGSHEMGDVFLELFIETLKDNYSNKWNLNDFYKKKKLTVEKNKTIGPINKEYTEGGNIDLIITSSNKQGIIIENKINAPDQLNQLLRYHNYGKKKFSGFELLYLTLDGRQASDNSTGEILKEVDYKKMSYKKDILCWLKACKDNPDINELLKATIVQYIYLVETLTGTTNYNKMEKEIQKKIINDKLSFEVAKEINKQYNKIINKIIPGNATDKINCVLKERFNVETEFLLFKYEEYEIWISVIQDTDWCTQITPYQKGNIGIANDEAIDFIRKAGDPLRTGTERSNNMNHVFWRFSKWEFENLELNKYLNIYNNEGALEWANLVIDETEEILIDFIKNIVMQGEEINKKIKWNEENQKLKWLLDSVNSTRQKS